MENAKAILGLIVQGSMFLFIMAIAMEANGRRVLDQVRHPKLLLRGIVAVNLVVPAVATILALVLPMQHEVAAGMLLMAISPLAPLVPGTALKTGARRSSIIALYLLLIIAAIPLVPLTVLILDHIFATNAVASVAPVAKVVLVSGVIPIVLGLLLGTIAPDIAHRAGSILQLISFLILGLFVLLLLWVAAGTFLSMLGNWTIIAFFLTSGSGIIAGHVLGGVDPPNRGALAFAAATRHPGIAAVIGHAAGVDSRVLLATLLFLLNGVIAGALYQAWLRRHPGTLAEPDQNSASTTPF